MAKRRWVPIVIGVVILFGFLVIGLFIAGAAWFAQNVEFAAATAGDADVEFKTIRDKYAGRPPLLEITENHRPRFSGGEQPPFPATAAPIDALHVLVWDPEDDELGRIRIPFWLLRMQSEPIRFNQYASGMDDEGVRLRPEDIERYGPGIVLDFISPKNERVLVWTQ